MARQQPTLVHIGDPWLSAHVPHDAGYRTGQTITHAQYRAAHEPRRAIPVYTHLAPRAVSTAVVCALIVVVAIAVIVWAGLS